MPTAPAGSHGHPEHSHTVPPRQRVPWGWALGSLAVGLVLGGGAVSATWGIAGALSSSGAATMQTALNTCEIASDSWSVDYPESGDSVTFDGVGLAYSDVSFDEVGCFGTELGMPGHVTSEMEQTRALDGRRDASWRGFTVSWSYHPDSGMNAIFAISDEH